MSLLIVPSDLLSHISSFSDNKTNTCFFQACKYLANHAKNVGYVTHIKYILSTNMMTFLHRFCQHSKTIKTVEMHGVDDPHIWLPCYVERLIFEHCAIPDYINPQKIIHATKQFKLTDYLRSKDKTTLRVNWKCFPNLEELELYVHSVDLTGIEYCTKLKRVLINTIN
jgi:hypothetical protein